MRVVCDIDNDQCVLPKQMFCTESKNSMMQQSEQPGSQATDTPPAPPFEVGMLDDRYHTPPKILEASKLALQDDKDSYWGTAEIEFIIEEQLKELGRFE